MKKNILIVDDSALMRKVLSDIVISDERFQVVAVATNGVEALSLIKQGDISIDAILLDLNMPRMNGIELLIELKKIGFNKNIIIVSTVAKADAKETILALELGAFDFVTKPETFMELIDRSFSDKLLASLSSATEVQCINIDISKQKSTKYSKSRTNKLRKTQASSYRPDDHIFNKIVALACSTGGPKALNTIIPTLPENLDASILIVQHMPEGFTKSLADRLNEVSSLRVKEAEDNEIIRKGTIYIAKGGHQMRVKKGSEGYYLAVTKEPARKGLLPCANIMYESLVDTDMDHITCVVLTGMGNDGTDGISKLKQNKNIYVIAQNEETCTVYGMPKAIKDAGLVDEEVALNDVSDAIIKNVGVY